jgi:AraC-like DNA-binding protein
MIFAFGAFIAFFLSIIVLTKRGRALHDIVLGTWLAVIGLHFGQYYLFVSNDLMRYPHLLGCGIPFPFFHGPLLYLYIQAWVQPAFFKKKRWLLHFLVPGAVIFVIAPFVMLPAEQKIAIFRNEGKGYEHILMALAWSMRVSGILYIVITYSLLQNHKKSIANTLSHRAKIEFRWFQVLYYGMAALWFVIIFIGGDKYIFPVAVLFLFLIGYLGIKQVGIFSNQPLETYRMELDQRERKKYEKSGLGEQAAKELHERLIRLMLAEKPYLDTELTLGDLAARLQTHPNYLSQIINEMEGGNFYDYINALRIQEFIDRVKDPTHQRFTLVALAFDCGFNSKTTFNRNFKKITGQTPSAYLGEMAIQLDER